MEQELERHKHEVGKRVEAARLEEKTAYDVELEAD